MSDTLTITEARRLCDILLGWEWDESLGYAWDGATREEGRAPRLTYLRYNDRPLDEDGLAILEAWRLADPKEDRTYSIDSPSEWTCEDHWTVTLYCDGSKWISEEDDLTTTAGRAVIQDQGRGER